MVFALLSGMRAFDNSQLRKVAKFKPAGPKVTSRLKSVTFVDKQGATNVEMTHGADGLSWFGKLSDQ